MEFVFFPAAGGGERNEDRGESVIVSHGENGDW